MNMHPSSSISTNAPFALVVFIAYHISHFYWVARLFLHHPIYSFIIAHSYLHMRGYYKVSLVSTLFNFIVFSRFSWMGLSGNFYFLASQSNLNCIYKSKGLFHAYNRSIHISAKLMNYPFLLLFIFDGPKRPSIKRGKKVKGEAHWLTYGTKRMVEAFGFEWRTVSSLTCFSWSVVSNLSISVAMVRLGHFP